MQKKEWFPAVLQLFAEGGDGGAAGEGAADAGQQETGESGDKFRNVVFGKDPAAQDSAAPDKDDAAAGAAETPAKTDFDSLIKGEYKEEFGKKVEEIVQKRLKNAKETVERYEALTPMLDLLGRKYGVDPKDAGKLAAAIEDDNAYYEADAVARGMDVETLKNVRKLERQNADLLARERDRDAQIRAEQDVHRWIEQAEAAKTRFPGLDLRTELQNEAFTRLLQSGIDVGNAYLVIHADELVPAAMQQAAEKGKAMAAAAVAAGKNRPKESGAGAKTGVVYKNDPDTWTEDEFEEVKRRVRSGARIVL